MLYLEFEQALVELESNSDIRTTLREIFFTGAKEIDAAGKKAICINIPVPQQKTFQKIQVSVDGTSSPRLSANSSHVVISNQGMTVSKVILYRGAFWFVVVVSIGEVGTGVGEEIQWPSCSFHCSATHSLIAKAEPEDKAEAA